MANSENVCPQAWGGARGALAREVRRLAARPPPGVKLLLDGDAAGDDLSRLSALIEGPADTPYAGGVFEVRLEVCARYPAVPPRAVFATRVFHPNVSARGEVCVNTLARDWRPELGLAHALVAVRCLLIAPNPDSALNAEAAALLRDRYQDYFARAKLYTEIHARPHTHPPAPPAPRDPPETRPARQEAGEASEAGEAGGADEAGRAEGPSAKRERRGAARGGRGERDKRRILKRL